MSFELLERFLNTSPTAFHAVENIVKALDENSFERLEEREVWTLQAGKSYYLTRNRSTVIAFRIPEKGFAPFQIVTSHSDSPCFKLKPMAAHRSAEIYAALNVEKYGGMLMSTWLDRPLSLAGRLIARKDGGLRTYLVDLAKPFAVIPNLPIHFNRDANDGVAYNAQNDMLPIFGMGEDADALQALADCAGVSAESVVSGDIFLYNAEKVCRWGINGEFFSAPRIDDLECAFASLQALISSKPSEHIDVMAVFDNEEVGNGTKQGADSDLLDRLFARIAEALGADAQTLSAAIAGSMMLSADNAHAVHPNHPEKYDKENRCRMNGGVVIKRNANQKYMTDAVSEAVFEEICRAANVPVQHFANRSDIAGGSTLGNIANAHTSMNTVDIGLAQLAMHSAYESAGVEDVEYMIRAMRAFHEAEIDILRDGEIVIR